MAIQQNQKWAYEAVVYQIYPRSFKDNNGDGIGDLPGIIEKLDYLQDLGVGAIWLSPIYNSPMVDFGYDVADYKGIEPMFGTMEDFDRLVEQAHAKGIKVMMDFVPNHTSNQHPWFLESKSSRDNPKRNWYMWRDPLPTAEDQPVDSNNRRVPNNWLSVFGGSGWEWDEQTGQYYFHSFLKEQPDLNWRNPEVQEAMFEVLKFWLNKGVDGFRTDAIAFLLKDGEFRDNPLNPDYREGAEDPYNQHQHVYSAHQNDLFTLIGKFCDILKQYPDAFMISEIYGDIPQMMQYFKACDECLHSPFNFNLISLPWRAPVFRKFLNEFEHSLRPHDWPNYVLGNHDRPRIATRLESQEAARMAAMMLLTLRGMLVMYYGDELGMEDVKIPFEEAQDPWEKNVPNMGLGRDPERTPMQWDASSFAGFSAVKPWLPVAPDFKDRNVERQAEDSKSMLSLYKRLIRLRRTTPALLKGNLKVIDVGNDNILAYFREYDIQGFLILLNFADDSQEVSVNFPVATIVSTYMDRAEGEAVDLSNFTLRPKEGLLFRVMK